jgi:hypothetical protein
MTPLSTLTVPAQNRKTICLGKPRFLKALPIALVATQKTMAWCWV